jgi:hypothetical protein
MSRRGHYLFYFQEFTRYLHVDFTDFKSAVSADFTIPACVHANASPHSHRILFFPSQSPQAKLHDWKTGSE